MAEALKVMKCAMLYSTFCDLPQLLQSVTLTLALMDGKMGVEEAVRISNLESNYQTQVWGRFESSHELEHFQVCSRVSAGLLFAKLSAIEDSAKLAKTA